MHEHFKEKFVDHLLTLQNFLAIYLFFLCRHSRRYGNAEVYKFVVLVDALGVVITYFELFYPFKCQPHKMVKHTQTIRRQFADKLFECV